jgi:uncharacterized membrane protein (DUF4010 family)
MDPYLREIAGIVVAALGGAAIGLERQWSGHAEGPQARFAGIRTFTLLGGFAGMAGWLWQAGATPLAAVLAGGGAALVVAAYVAGSRREVDGTTEVAALVALGAGILAGAGRMAMASGIIAATALLLVEKSRLHAVVSRIDDTSLTAGIRFAVMAIVILPLLPTGPYGPLGGVRPRELWAIVLFFSGLSFAGYLAKRGLGPRYGYAVTGLLGGLVSSTSVTFTFAGVSRGDRGFGPALAAGVLAANTVLFIRVAIVLAVLNAALLPAMLPYVVAPFLVGVAATLVGLVRQDDSGEQVTVVRNPLQLGMALKMTLVFQVVLFVVYAATAAYGDLGVLVSGAVVGFADVDALLLSMAHAETTVATDVAARAIVIGILSNTVLKTLLAGFLGRGRFRQLTVAGLVVMGLALGLSVWLIP